MSIIPQFFKKGRKGKVEKIKQLTKNCHGSLKPVLASILLPSNLTVWPKFLTFPLREACVREKELLTPGKLGFSSMYLSKRMLSLFKNYLSKLIFLLVLVLHI